MTIELVCKAVRKIALVWIVAETSYEFHRSMQEIHEMHKGVRYGRYADNLVELAFDKVESMMDKHSKKKGRA